MESPLVLPIAAMYVDAIRYVSTRSFETSLLRKGEPASGSVHTRQISHRRCPCYSSLSNRTLRSASPTCQCRLLQAIFVMSVLIDQKIQNGAFQLPPAEWDRDVYPRAMEQERARQELQRRIAAGEVQVQATFKFEFDGWCSSLTPDATLLRLLQQRVLAMSVADGLKLLQRDVCALGHSVNETYRGSSGLRQISVVPGLFMSRNCGQPGGQFTSLAAAISCPPRS